MTGDYRIFGGELSPYSIKVRAYFRYKRIAHRWIVRNLENMEEYERYAKVPLIPLVVTPDDRALQDSTPILEALEREFPEPAIQPPDPTRAFLSALIEEFGDEWAVKPMFHYRWTYEADQESASLRIARDMGPGFSDAELAPFAESVRTRMVSRLPVVGSSPATRPTIEDAFVDLAAILERHLRDRPYLFGGRPALADFGLAPELYQCASDPTAGALLRERAPVLVAWTERMLDPHDEGPFEEWPALAPTLEPLLARQVARYFLSWSDANAAAVVAGEKSFTLELAGRAWTESAAKYPAKSLAVLRARYAAQTDRANLDTILERTGCLAWLLS